MSGRSLSLRKAGFPMLVLVVEDDSLINLMATDELKRAGYGVIWPSMPTRRWKSSKAAAISA